VNRAGVDAGRPERLVSGQFLLSKCHAMSFRGAGRDHRGGKKRRKGLTPGKRLRPGGQRKGKESRA